MPFESNSHMSMSGNDLLKTFKDLGIHTGNVNKLTIEAWFDTYCQGTKEIFEWMCKYLSKDNALTALELDEYEQLEQSGRILSDKQYEAELAKLSQSHPGILDAEENSFDVECMEDELDLLFEEREHLQQVFTLHKAVKQKLSRTFNSLQDEEIMYNLEKNSAAEMCIELSVSLDKAQEKLQQQIIHYSKHLNNFDYDTRIFLSNIPMDKFSQNYKDLMSYLNLFLEQGDLCQGDYICEDNLEELEVLRERITLSTIMNILAKNEEERVKSKLEYLKNFQDKDSSKTLSLNDSLQIKDPKFAVHHEVLLNELRSSIESVAQKFGNAIVDKPKTTILNQLLETKKEKLDYFKKVYSQTSFILATYLLKYLLFHKEKANIESTDSFFRNVNQYIMQNVYNSQLRCEVMTEMIASYDRYEGLPLEEKLPLVGIMKKLLSENENDTTPLLNIIREFNNDYQQTEEQVFLKDFAHHRQFTRVLEKKAETLRNFLSTSPTLQITVVPNSLCDILDEVNQLIVQLMASSRASSQKINTAVKTISGNKWFKMRRQLWIWFIMEPKKVRLAIDEIEAYVKQIRNKI